MLGKPGMPTDPDALAGMPGFDTGGSTPVTGMQAMSPDQRRMIAQMLMQQGGQPGGQQSRFGGVANALGNAARMYGVSQLMWDQN